MDAFSVLCLVTTGALAIGALALAPSRIGAARALALLLGVNAMLVGLALIRQIGVETPPATSVLVVGLFALSPPLLALAMVRVRSHGPLVRSDRRVAVPAAVTLAAALTTLLVAGRVFPTARFEIGYLVAFNVIALVSFVTARRALPSLADAIRQWGTVLVIVFGVHWVSSMGSWVAGVIGATAWGSVLEVVSISTLLAFGLAAAWGALRQLPSVLPVPPPPPDPALERADARLAERVRDVLEGDQLYLDPALTVETLSTGLREATRDVSRVLNARLGGGFHDVVGCLRVAHAQRLLLAEPDATVLEVLHRSGFSSTSAFHRVFRQHAGTSPGAWRRMPGAHPLTPLGGDGARGDGAVQAIPQPELGRHAG